MPARSRGRPGRGARLPRAQRRGQDHDDPAAARPAAPDDGPGRDLRARRQRRAVEAHRRLAYVPGETNLWPGLTGEETLHLLGRVHGAVDAAYRDVLVERFSFDPSKKVRAYSKGNRQKLLLIAALMSPARPADPRRADERSRPAHGAGVPAVRGRGARAEGQTVFLSSHILSEVEALCDRVGILRAGELVEIGTLAEMRHLSALSVEATFDAAPPDLSRVPGVDRGTGRRATASAARSTAPSSRCSRVLAAVGRPRAAEPRAVARGAVPRPLRVRRARDLSGRRRTRRSRGSEPDDARGALRRRAVPRCRPPCGARCSARSSSPRCPAS